MAKVHEKISFMNFSLDPQQRQSLRRITKPRTGSLNRFCGFKFVWLLQLNLEISSKRTNYLATTSTVSYSWRLHFLIAEVLTRFKTRGHKKLRIRIFFFSSY